MIKTGRPSTPSSSPVKLKQRDALSGPIGFHVGKTGSGFRPEIAKKVPKISEGRTLAAPFGYSESACSL